MKANKKALLEHESAVRAFLASLHPHRNRGKHGSRKRRFTVSIEELEDEPVAPAKTPTIDILDAFAAVLRHLSLRERQVLLLRIAGTMSSDEIAVSIGGTNKAVARAFERACRKARTKVRI